MIVAACDTTSQQTHHCERNTINRQEVCSDVERQWMRVETRNTINYLEALQRGRVEAIFLKKIPCLML
jgi:hypothetical protein